MDLPAARNYERRGSVHPGVRAALAIEQSERRTAKGVQRSREWTRGTEEKRRIRSSVPLAFLRPSVPQPAVAVYAARCSRRAPLTSGITSSAKHSISSSCGENCSSSRSSPARSNSRMRSATGVGKARPRPPAVHHVQPLAGARVAVVVVELHAVLRENVRPPSAWRREKRTD